MTYSPAESTLRRLIAQQSPANNAAVAVGAFAVSAGPGISTP